MSDTQGEACYVVDVDGEPVLVRLTEPFTDDELAAFREIVRAARRRMDEEQDVER